MSSVEQQVQGESSINVDYVIFILNNYKLLITLILTTMAFSLSPPPPPPHSSPILSSVRAAHSGLILARPLPTFSFLHHRLG